MCSRYQMFPFVSQTLALFEQTYSLHIRVLMVNLTLHPKCILSGSLQCECYYTFFSLTRPAAECVVFWWWMRRPESPVSYCHQKHSVHRIVCGVSCCSALVRKGVVSVISDRCSKIVSHGRVNAWSQEKIVPSNHSCPHNTPHTIRNIL
jgi:hypothetical protein